MQQKQYVLVNLWPPIAVEHAHQWVKMGDVGLIISQCRICGDIKGEYK